MSIFETKKKYPRYHVELDLHRDEAGELAPVFGHTALGHAATFVIGIAADGTEHVLKDRRPHKVVLNVLKEFAGPTGQEHVNHTMVTAGIAAANEHIYVAKRDLDSASRDQLEREKWTNRELAIFLQTHLCNARSALATASVAISFVEKRLDEVIAATEPRVK
jgi:hypothetical protein